MLLVKKICHEQYIKQVELSKMTGINETTISLIVNGRMVPYPVQAKKIKLALGYEGDADELFKEVLDA